MIVFSSSSSTEMNEGDEQIVIEIDGEAAEITEPIEVPISTGGGSAVLASLVDDAVELDSDSVDSSAVIVDPNNADTLASTTNTTDDAIAEDDEDFQGEIISLEEESLNAIGTGIITDNEIVEDEIAEESELVTEGLLPKISINNVEQLEGDSGNTDFEFTVSLSEPSEEVVTVDFSTADGIAEAEAMFASLVLVDPADYIPVDGTLEFMPGETEKTITVEVLTDNEFFADETPEETFLVNLANANNADIEQFAGMGIIVDDDLETEIIETLPFLRVDNQEFIEGDLGEDIDQNFIVSLVDANGKAFVATEDISFSFGTVDVTTSANLDYKFIESQSATIVAGQSSTPISITTIGDGQTEIDETLFVILSDIDDGLAQFSNGESELTAEVIIINDDAISDGDFLEELDDLDSSLSSGTVFRFFNTEAGSYFYTVSELEREFVEDNLDSFILEESSFASVAPDSSEDEVDIFRFFNSTTGGYLYTADVAERDFVTDNLPEFAFEGVAFSAFDSDINDAEDSIPVYRFFETGAGVHFYTADENEKTFIEDNLPNFNFEGIAFNALPVEADII